MIGTFKNSGNLKIIDHLPDLQIESMLFSILILCICAYLIGSIPFGLILSKLSGYGDIRKIGSGNIGATNVLRTGNKTLALLTLILDSIKGAVFLLAITFILGPDILPNFYLSRSEIGEIIYQATGNMMNMALSAKHSFITYYQPEFLFVLQTIGLASILGHCFPIWLKFKGGKGVATALGVLLAAVPWAGVVACVTWGIVAGFFRYSSLSALCAVAIAPVATAIFYGPVPALITVLIAALVWWRHKDNIRRLLKGEEPKIGDKKKENLNTEITESTEN